MTTLGDLTAAELADGLEIMKHHPHNTGGLSMLDEATFSFGSKYPEVSGPQRAFARARVSPHALVSHRDRQLHGRGVAEGHRRGSRARCGPAAPRRHCNRQVRETGWMGNVRLPLDDDGQCRSTLGHTDDDQEAGQ